MARLLLNDKVSFEPGGSCEESANSGGTNYLLRRRASLGAAGNDYPQTGTC